MAKRTFWFVTGAATGLGSSLWLQRRVKLVVGRYVPEQVQARTAAAARRVVPAVRGAATEGRAAMRTREAEMHAGVAQRVSPSAPADRQVG